MDYHLKDGKKHVFYHRWSFIILIISFLTVFIISSYFLQLDHALTYTI